MKDGIYGEARIYREERPGRPKRYRVRFRWGGRTYSKNFRLGRNAERAKALANDALELLKAGRISIPPATDAREFVLSGGKDVRTIQSSASPPVPEPCTVDDLLDGYLKQAKPTREASTYATEVIHLGHLRKFVEAQGLTRRPATVLTRSVIRAYRTWRLESVGSATVNKEVATFSTAFNLAIEDGLLLGNPVSGLKRLKVDEQPEFRTGDEIERLITIGKFTAEEEKRVRKARILYTEEVDELLDLTQGRTVHVPLMIAAFTGARRGEIARLTWADVDLQHKKITLRSKKQSQRIRSKGRPVDIHERLLTALKAHKLRTGGQGYLFPPAQGDGHVAPQTLHTNLKKAVAKTKFTGIGWHTLRHSLASNLARASVDQRVINEIMGHTSDAMARRYRHLFPEQGRSAIDAVYKAG